jgi:hypothetical protein
MSRVDPPNEVEIHIYLSVVKSARQVKIAAVGNGWATVNGQGRNRSESDSRAGDWHGKCFTVSDAMGWDRVAAWMIHEVGIDREEVRGIVQGVAKRLMEVVGNG